MGATRQNGHVTKDQLQRLLDTTSDLIVMHDTEQRVLWTNEAVASSVGLPVDELVGKKCYKIWGAESPCPDCPVEAALRDGQSHTLSRRDRHGTGWNIQGFPIVENNGAITGVVEVTRNITNELTELEELRASEARARFALEHSGDWVWEIDTEGVYSYSNKQVMNLLGYEPEEILGRTPFEFMDPDEAERVEKEFTDLASDGRPLVSLEHTMLHRDGSEVILEVIGAQFYDDDGTPLGYRGVMRDMTERRKNEYRTEVLLRLNELANAPLKELTDYALEEIIKITGSSIGYLALMTDDESALIMHSWSREAMETCAMDDKPIYYPIEQTGLWGEAVRQRKPIITNDYAAPNEFKKGQPEGHVQTTRHMNAPIFDGDQIVAVAGVGNKKGPYTEDDVRQLSLIMNGTWQIVKRQREQQQTQTFQNIIENATDGVTMTDLEGKIEFANHAWYDMLGFDFEENEMSGEYIGSVWSAEDADMLADEILPLARYEGWRGEAVQVKKDGHQFDAAITAFPLTNEEGEPEKLVQIVRDVSELKEAEETLRRQNDAILEMSTPVIGLWHGIVLLPIVGVLDTQRSQLMMERLLKAVVDSEAQVVLLDVTGVPIIDTGTAQHLIKTVEAARVLGASVVITGFSPDAAQTLTQLNVDFSALRTRGSLRAGVVEAFNLIGRKVIGRD